MRDESRGRPIQKAKVEIILGKSEQFNDLMAAAAEEREVFSSFQHAPVYQSSGYILNNAVTTISQR